MNIVGSRLSSNGMASILGDMPTGKHLHGELIDSEAMGIKTSNAAMDAHINCRRGWCVVVWTYERLGCLFFRGP